MSAVAAVTTAMGLRPTTAFQRFTDYTVHRDDKAFYLGTDGDVSAQYNATRGVAVFDGQGNAVEIRGLNMAPDRITLIEPFHKAPKLNADVLSATEATNEICNRDFELLGVNAVSGSSLLHAEGGVRLTTAGADGDECIVLPHLDANESAWATTTWGTDKSTRWEAVIRTGANITNAIIWAGLKLTNTEVTATDADQAFFRYEDDVNSGKWQCNYSIANVDTTTDSTVAVAVSTTYHLVIDIDSSRIARFYINGTLRATSTALTTAIDLIPYIGVAADGAAAAKTLDVYKEQISRAPAA